MKAIHQFTAGFTKGDAISNEAVLLRKIFRSWGYESHIFCEPHRVLPQLRPQTYDAALAETILKPGDLAVLHLSIGSAVNDLFAALKCRRAIIYHNITPPEYFRGIHEQIARDLAWGRQQAAKLAGAAEIVMAVSRFNADELKSMGYGPAQILPLILDASALKSSPDRGVLRSLADGKTNVLFVGRGAPNKRIEDLLCAFHYFQSTLEKNSRFIHVGSYTGLERYQALVQALARRLDIRNCVFAGSVNQQELNAYYAGAHLFLCMSEHEGFCIPLLESMVHDLPVMAYAAGAVPETLAGAGVLFREKNWDEAAEMAGKILNDRELRAGIISGQRERLRRYTGRDLEGELKKTLAPVLAR
ncbi:MAG: glycosyltransferase [Kiritimatiellae bacterium]|nr:glycosyltransferase [Kiritimatiellia bacterium]